MNKKARIEELEASVEHLQDRVDRVRDYVQEYKTSNIADWYFNKFQTLIDVSLKFDKNSKEYEELRNAAIRMLELFYNSIGE